jgi:hypothetical protein
VGPWELTVGLPSHPLPRQAIAWCYLAAVLCPGAISDGHARCASAMRLKSTTPPDRLPLPPRPRIHCRARAPDLIILILIWVLIVFYSIYEIYGPFLS